MSIKILQGDCIEVMRKMDAESVDCVVTSPPYWGLRSYDETAYRIDPNLSKEKRQWLLTELNKRGINAKF